MAVSKANSKTESKTVNVGVIDISSTGVSAIALECEGYASERFLKLGFCDTAVGMSDYPSRAIYKAREELAILSYVEGLSLNERGIEKIVSAVNDYLDKLKELDVVMCYVVATAISRTVENFKKVKTIIEAECGVRVTELDGEDEATSDALANCDMFGKNAYIIDIGTASIEFAELNKEFGFEFMSMPFGVYHLSTLVKGTHPTKKEGEKIRNYIDYACGLAPCDYSDCKIAVLVGTTVNAIYKVYAAKFGISAPNAEHMIEAAKLKKLTKYLIEDETRNVLILKTVPERLHTIATACILLERLISYYKTETVIVSAYGLKEGLPYYAPTAGIFPTLLKPEAFDECKKTIFLLSASKVDCLPVIPPKQKAKKCKQGKLNDFGKIDKNSKNPSKKKKPLISLPDLSDYWEDFSDHYYSKDYDDDEAGIKKPGVFNDDDLNEI